MSMKHYRLAREFLWVGIKSARPVIISLLPPLRISSIIWREPGRGSVFPTATPDGFPIASIGTKPAVGSMAFVRNLEATLKWREGYTE
jgi:hypothetical protein